MENKVSVLISQKLQRQSCTKSLVRSSENSNFISIKKDESGISFSLYNDKPALSEDYKQESEVFFHEQSAKLTAAFPDLHPNFFNLLFDRVIETQMTKKRFADSVNYVIDNFKYKVPNISDFISFDKRRKLYTHKQMCNLITSKEEDHDNFEQVRVNGVLYFAIKNDI